MVLMLRSYILGFEKAVIEFEHINFYDKKVTKILMGPRLVYYNFEHINFSK